MILLNYAKMQDIYLCDYCISNSAHLSDTFAPVINRLPLLPRKTMEKKKEKHNGLLHRGLCMVFNHLKQAAFSRTRTVTGSFQRSPSKPRDALRWQGMHISEAYERVHGISAIVFLIIQD